MDEEVELCVGPLASNTVMLVDSKDLEGAVEGTGTTPMDIDEEMQSRNSGLIIQELSSASNSQVVAEVDEETEDDEATITKLQDIRNVTSQYLQGDLTCTEYATAIEGLVDVDSDEIGATQQLDIISPDNKNALQIISPIGNDKNLASYSTDSTSMSLNMNSSGKDSSAGFYGSGTTPAIFTIFRKRKLSATLERLLGAAHVRYAQGDYKSAIDMCMEIIKEQPTCIEPFQTLSMIYENQNRTSKSLQFALIAGLLSPKTCTEWPKLAEMSFEEDNFPQAIMCYTNAIKADPKNPDIYKRRCELMDLYGDTKGALKSYAQILILFPEQGSLCIDILRKMSRIYYDNGDIIKAYETLNVAFNDHFKSQITTEEINLMLELCISLKKYVEAFEIIVEHAGVEVNPPVDPLAFESRRALTQALRSEDIMCEIPSSLNVELLAKLIGILIHLEAFHLSEKLVSILKTSDVDSYGDLYLDVAEAYMSKQNYSLAITALFPLIGSNKFSVAAVWLRYAECLFLLQRLEDAAHAYEKVVVLAPNHTLAKLNLSIILQRLGRADDALETLVHADKEEDPIDPTIMIERCNILLNSSRFNEFIQTARLLLSRHCPRIRNMEESQVIIMATNKTRKRYEALQIERKIRGEPLEDDNIPNFIDKITNSMSEWKIYLKLCRILVHMERYDILSNVVYSACGSKLFAKNIKMEKACEMHCYYASLMCSDTILLPHHVRIILSNFPKNRRVLNMFSMTLQRCESDTRFGRHVLRLLMKRPNDTRLMLLNGHISFVTGTYKNALMEYTTLFAETPSNPIVPLMIASVLLHVLTQKTSTSRAQLCISVIGFIKKYFELRGECQEAYYNMGRVMHYIGFLPLAVQYYKRVLATKPVRVRVRRQTLLLPGGIGNENTLDLKREAAFNLAHIYRSNGSHHLARLYLYSFIRV